MEDIRAHIRQLIKAINGEEPNAYLSLVWWFKLPGQRGDADQVAAATVLKALENIARKPGGTTLVADLQKAARIVEGFELGTRPYLIHVRIQQILDLDREPISTSKSCALCGGPGVQTFRLMPRPYDEWSAPWPETVCRLHADARVRKRHLRAMKRSLAPLSSLKAPWTACTSAPWFLPMEFFNMETEEFEVWPLWLRRRFQRKLRSQDILDVWHFLIPEEIRPIAYSAVVATLKTSRRRQRASRNNGKLGGRPLTYSSSQVKRVCALRAKGISQTSIATQTGLSQATVSRLLKAQGSE